MAQLQINNPAVAGALRARPHFRVTIRKAWTDDWLFAPYLTPVSATWSAGPSVSRAKLLYRAGMVRMEDEPGFKNKQPLAIRDWFVRIEMLGADGHGNVPVWTGIIAEDEREYGGTSKGPMADQTLTAYGLEHLLDRELIAGSAVSNNDDGNAVFIGKDLAFNEDFALGFLELGNRSGTKLIGPPDDPPLPDPRTSYVFGPDKEVWTVRDMVEYLLLWFGPRGVRIDLAGQTDALDAIVIPRVHVAGQSVFAVLNEIIDRKRGLGWCVDAAPGEGNEVTLRVFTTIGTAARVGEKSIPANPDKSGAINVEDFEHLVAEDRLAIDSNHQYGTIIVQGEPLVSMFTLSFQDKTLIKGWSTSQETDYKSGSGVVAGTSAAKLDQERGTDKFRNVYTTFKVKDGWDWQAGDGAGARRRTPIRPSAATARSPACRAATPTGRPTARRRPANGAIACSAACRWSRRWTPTRWSRSTGRSSSSCTTSRPSATCLPTA
jgi:hypothetical protein